VGRVALRPVLKLTIVAGQRQLSCYAVVDSGADHCVFPRQFLQTLGLDPLLAPSEPISGVGSSGISAHFFNLAIDLQGLVQFPVYVGFTTGLDEIGLGLLGQNGFFDRFHIHFKLSQRIYEIEPI
jgi:hypothetical protein